MSDGRLALELSVAAALGKRPMLAGETPAMTAGTAAPLRQRLGLGMKQNSLYLGVLVVIYLARRRFDAHSFPD